jgi:hypothetical protein
MRHETSHGNVSRATNQSRWFFNNLFHGRENDFKGLIL